MPQWNQIAEKLQHEVGKELIITSAQRVMGGDINESYSINATDGTCFFIKTNAKHRLPMFEAELDGLAVVAASNTIRVPNVYFYGQTDTESYLILEYLEFGQRRDDRQLGHQLAAMHECTQADFGWNTNNTIGSTVQINSLHSNWCEFWVDNRLSPQLEIAKANNCGTDLLDLGLKLIEKSPCLFANHNPDASLLHGDLWGGNAACLHDGTPVIFDPAIYFGDREVDLAMMELFGGFNKNCFAAYHESWQIDQSGYRLRKPYYNLYHLLNHYNLFGDSYYQQCIESLQRILAEI